MRFLTVDVAEDINPDNTEGVLYPGVTIFHGTEEGPLVMTGWSRRATDLPAILVRRMDQVEERVLMWTARVAVYGPEVISS